MVDPRRRPVGTLGVLDAATTRALIEAQRKAEEQQTPTVPPRGSYLLSEITNDSATMTGTTAKDVFDAGVSPPDITDSAADPGTGAVGFARADHVHAHPALRGGDAHALASTLTHGFMSKGDKAALDSLVDTSEAEAALTEYYPASGLMPSKYERDARSLSELVRAANTDYDMLLGERASSRYNFREIR